MGGGNHAPVCHHHSARTLGYCFAVAIHVGRVRAQWIYYYGAGIGACKNQRIFEPAMRSGEVAWFIGSKSPQLARTDAYRCAAVRSLLGA